MQRIERHYSTKIDDSVPYNYTCNKAATTANGQSQAPENTTLGNAMLPAFVYFCSLRPSSKCVYIFVLCVRVHRQGRL